MGRTAIRIIGVEYLQNFPILLGLTLALTRSTWTVRLLCAASGSVATALLIATTEGWKLGKSVGHRERPADAVANALTFFGGVSIYLGYYFLIRQNAASPALADAGAGLALGGIVGMLQALTVDERRITAQAVTHTVGLALAGCLLFVLLGTLGGTLSELEPNENMTGMSSVAVWRALGLAFALCVPITLIIVRLDYWQLLTSKTTTVTDP